MPTNSQRCEKVRPQDVCPQEVLMAQGKGCHGTARTRAHAGAVSRLGFPDVSLRNSPFHSDLWLFFTVLNWLLYCGRALVIIMCPVEWCPLNRPSPADYIHLASNLCTALLLLKITQQSPKTLPHSAMQLSIIIFAMGTSMHLVGDSVTQRLILSGYQLHLPLRENPVIQNVTPTTLISSFELVSYYDEGLGHVMWGVPFLLILFLYFTGCFTHSKEDRSMPFSAWLLLGPSALLYWYVITEGQIFILFTFTLFAMASMVVQQRPRGLGLNSNGLFLLSSFSSAMGLVVLWAAVLWRDPVLRKRYPGVMYVPRPGAFYTLHFLNTHSTVGPDIAE
ncbi:ceroid-lipofuscinosis neuronal protein 6-like [Sardina pilchardus]|uniref:ceroid-lipofuscinosis neuronal protein 6-like n=1 Tax=Sardina pilchardus TaxID=27697 RepID=UPI002E104032